MDLRDRGRGHRLVLERGEQLGQRPLQLGLDQRLGLGRGEGGQPILQLGQVVGDCVAQEIAAHGQRLAELDEGRAQLLQRPSQPLARPALGAAIGHAFGHPAHGRGHRQQIHREQGVVPGEAARGRDHPRAIAEFAEHQRGLRPMELTDASRSGSRRSRPKGCGSVPAPGRPPSSGWRRRAGRGTCGCSRPGSGSWPRRGPRSARAGARR